ncbi:hypothetical protein FACHB389_31660 [Nostoc calcicola FACHB-389]|nr:hypothetical protein FACHB389_31660 [Nostoc calcicola FACHB-389]
MHCFQATSKKFLEGIYGIYIVYPCPLYGLIVAFLWHPRKFFDAQYAKMARKFLRAKSDDQSDFQITTSN